MSRLRIFFIGTLIGLVIGGFIGFYYLRMQDIYYNLRIQELEDKVSNLERDLSTKENEIKLLEDKVSNLERDLSTKENEIKLLEDKVDKLVAKIKRLEDDVFPRIICDFETLENWNLIKGNPLTPDFENVKEGNQGIKWTSSNAVATVADKTIRFDGRGKHFQLWVYIDNKSKLDYFCIWALAGDEYFYWSSRSEGFHQTGLMPGWNRISLSRANFWTPGNGNWTEISKVKIMVLSKDGKSVNLTFDDFRMVPDQFKGMVTLRFDDSENQDHYTIAKPVLDKYGFKGVHACVINQVGRPGALTLDQLISLNKSGWDIISHTMTHRDLTTLTDNELEWELRESQKWLIEKGFSKGSRFFLPPWHRWNKTVMAKIKNYYLGCQTVHGNFETIPPTDRYRMCVLSGVDNTTKLEWIKSWIDKAKDNNAWLTLMFHELDGMEMLLRDICDYIEKSGLEVVTFSDVFDLKAETDIDAS